MWSTLSGDNLKETQEVREVVVEFFKTGLGLKFFQLLMTDYFHWKGPLMNDEDVHLHNAGQRFLGFLYGTDTVPKEQFEVELRALLDSEIIMSPEKPSGQSDGWHDSAGRQKRTKRNG